MTDSRIAGFYKLSLEERRRILGEATGLTAEHIASAVHTGGMDAALWDKVVENVVGTYALPFGIALNFLINGQDRLVPMVVEEPSVIAAASNAARMTRSAGGFQAEMLEQLMIGQIQLFNVPDPVGAQERLLADRANLLALAVAAAPGLIAHGGGPRDIEVRDLGQGMVVVHILVDCCDAMGANIVNTIAEALGPRVAALGGGTLGLRILSNLADRRRVRVTCRVHARELPGRELAGKELPGDLLEQGLKIIDAMVQASRFAELDPYRATTHNKGIMNGLDAVVIAAGNDWRAVEAGAHAYACRSGTYRPLSTWRRDGEQLVGTLDLPMALGTVGGALRVHPAAQLSLELMGATTARELAMISASAGLASNLAAVRALATEGIQRGHMALHARSVALSVGASDSEIDPLVRRLQSLGQISATAARAELEALRAKP